MRRLAETLAKGRALVPYLTAFDPSAESFVDAALGAVDGGAAALEIGLPFSDPVADGPIIQRAHARALDAGGSVAGSLGLVKALRGRTSVPLVLFTYFNPVLAFGPLEFLEAARSAGADGILCLDCPPEEEPGWFHAVTASGLDPIVLLGPNTGAGRAPLILERGGGFVYVVAREGVTGSGLGAAGAPGRESRAGQETQRPAGGRGLRREGTGGRPAALGALRRRRRRVGLHSSSRERWQRRQASGGRRLRKASDGRRRILRPGTGERMLIKMRASATMGQTNAVLSYIEKNGCTARTVDLPYGRYIAGQGAGQEAIVGLEGAAGVEWVRDGAGPALAALETNPEGTVVPLGDSLVGGETIAVMAGPCSVESGDQVLTCARFVAAYGATVLRGGAFKPRTSPYSFQGLGTEALEWLEEAGRAVRLPVVSEILDPGDVEMSAAMLTASR